MKHNHCVEIKQWADDTSLVILYKDEDIDTLWCELPQSSQRRPAWNEDNEYYLVCRKHVELCLEWLNRGKPKLDMKCDDEENYAYLKHLVYEPTWGEANDYRFHVEVKLVECYVGISKIQGRETIALTPDGYKNLHPKDHDQYYWTHTELNTVDQIHSRY